MFCTNHETYHHNVWYVSPPAGSARGHGFANVPVKWSTGPFVCYNTHMGIKQIITDDLTGDTLSDDVKTTDVRVDGEDYSVYLSDESKETFIAFLKGEAPLLQVQQRPAARRSPARAKSNAAEIRAWAKDQGLQVPDRGRIPADVMEAWDKK